jgi:hypothetical protein
MFCRNKEEKHWRTNLNNGEKRILIPAIKTNLKIIKDEYLKYILGVCSQHKNDAIFGEHLLNLTKAFQATALSELTPQQMAAKFCSEIETNVKENYIKPIENLLTEYEDISSIEAFSFFLNRSAFILGSLVNSQNELFFYEFNTFLSYKNNKTGEVIGEIPDDMAIILMPFKSTVRNMVLMAEWTKKSIDTWTQEEPKWKTKTLELEIIRKNIRNQTVVILFAIAISAFFLFGSIPFDNFQKSQIIEKITKENSDLRRQVDSQRQQSLEK